MAAGKIPTSTGTGSKWKQYAAGGPRDLIADGPGGSMCARRIVLLAAGDLSLCIGPDGATDSPLTGLPSGFEHVGATSSVTSTVGIIVYW